MWEPTTQTGKKRDAVSWNETILLVVFVAGAVVSVIIYWKSITLSGGDTVDRTNLLI